MAFNKYDIDKQGVSYMDGIPVKISEQYKPPKKISLPGTILNKLNAEITIPEYDFTLEKSVMDKMNQWRNLRLTQREERKKRIENGKKAKEGGEDVKAPEGKNTTSPEPSLSPSPSILTPVPINASTNSQSLNHSKSFNISDFEQDTASPFDNMELKTINDLEELAHVLQSTVISDRHETKLGHKTDIPPRLNGFTNQFNYNGCQNWTKNYDQVSGVVSPNSSYQEYNTTSTHHPPLHSTIQSYVVQRLEQNSKSVPDIVQQLELELRDKREAENRRNLEQPQRPASIGPAELFRKSESSPERTKKLVTEKSILPNPYAQLSSPCQQLTNRLAEMGFPLSRVARATQLFGDDETKVVEFLVQVQILEELNYPSDRAEKALIANNYKQSETIEYLNTLGQLLDLGFREEQVVHALSECGLDRDKVLDLLVS